MRIAFISDIHSSLIPLDAVIADARAAGVDGFVCLGDIVDLGPQPTETIARLRELGCPCIVGNHDPLDERPPVPFLLEVEEWTASVLSEADRAWLGALPFEVRLEAEDGQVVLGVHASPLSVNHVIRADTPDDALDRMLGDAAFDVMVGGHAHVQLLRRHGLRTIVNVGSVGQPFERVFSGPPPRVQKWAEYGIVECRGGALTVDLRRVPYDFEAFRQVILASTMPDPEGWLVQWER